MEVSNLFLIWGLLGGVDDPIDHISEKGSHFFFLPGRDFGETGQVL